MKQIDDFKRGGTVVCPHEERDLLVGAVAVNALGFLRTTEDFAFWPDRTLDDVDRVMATLDEFGFGGEFEGEDLLEPSVVLMMGRPANRRDLSTSISDRKFADCWERRTYETFDGVVAPLSAFRICSFRSLPTAA